LEMFSPREIIFPNSLAPLLNHALKPSSHSNENPEKSDTTAQHSGLLALSDAGPLISIDAALTALDDWIFGLDHAESLVRAQLGVSSLDGFGLNDRDYAVCSAGAAVHYVNETQKAQALHISEITFFETNDYLALDAPTVSNLELVISQDGKS